MRQKTNMQKGMTMFSLASGLLTGSMGNDLIGTTSPRLSRTMSDGPVRTMSNLELAIVLSPYKDEDDLMLRDPYIGQIHMFCAGRNPRFNNRMFGVLHLAQENVLLAKKNKKNFKSYRSATMQKIRVLLRPT
jgi:hypothetical protein